MYNSPFKWWVQSVMPVVFDDSLSYYEVLAKLTKYIEGLTGDVDQIEKILATIEGIEDITQFTQFLEQIQAEIGDLANLSTTSKNNLVSAINEVALKASIAYAKPVSGIPESDLSQSVQDKLNKTGSATEYIINNVTLKASPNNNSPSDLGLGTYSVPSGGIPWDTLSQDVRDRIESGSGGEGGTKDYNELSNKPQINGHTLNAGNNTNESLGIGTYSKPNTGIPESDLSEEVQEKLNTSGGIADSQESFVANRDYEAGELVYINGVLYKTKYNILTGTSMVPGNNIETTDISSELERINNDIESLQSGSGPDSWSLVTELTGTGSTNYLRFFEYFNCIGAEDYLFIFTPKSGTSTYNVVIKKRDGTTVENYTFSGSNQNRRTFTPADTGEYYCEFSAQTTSTVKIELEYTQSQGISELWAQVNKANQLEPRVGAVEELVEEQQTQLEELTDIPEIVDSLKSALNTIATDIKNGLTNYGNYYINANGALSLSGGWNAVYYDIDEFLVSEIEAYSSSPNIYAIGFYSGAVSDSNFIGGIKFNDGQLIDNNKYKFACPYIQNGTKYVVVCNYRSGGNLSVSGLNIQSMGRLQTIPSELDKSNDKIYELQNNTYTINQWLSEEGFISATGGDGLSSNYKRSDFIQVKTGDVIEYKITGHDSCPAIAFYTNDNLESYSSELVSGGSIQTGTLTIQNDGYIRCSCYIASIATSYLFFSGSLAERITELSSKTSTFTFSEKLTNNDNINNITKTGFYLFNSGSLPTGFPYGVFSGTLINIYNNSVSGERTQYLIDSTCGLTYIRKYHGGNWSEWVFQKSEYSGIISKNQGDFVVQIGKAIYTIRHVSNNEAHLDTWRIVSCKVIGADNELHTLWLGSDTDGVVRILGENDYIGGFHGYEMATSIKFIIDGVEVDDLSANIAKKPFKDFDVLIESDVYNNGTTDIAFKRNKIIRFNSDALSVFNNWTAQKSVTLIRAWFAMLSVNTYDSDNITKMLTGFYTNADAKYYDGSTETSTSPDMTEVTIMTTHCNATVEVKNMTQGHYKGFVSVRNDPDSGYRSKAYLGPIDDDSGVSLSANDDLRGEAYYKIC